MKKFCLASLLLLSSFLACSSLQAEKQNETPEIFDYVEFGGEGITEKVEKKIVEAIDRFVAALERGDLGEFEFEYALSKDEAAVLQKAVAESNLPQGVKEILQHVFAMGWFGKGKGGRDSCEKEGRRSSREICSRKDTGCKERVYKETRDTCYKHRGGKDGAGKGPEIEVRKD